MMIAPEVAASLISSGGALAAAWWSAQARREGRRNRAQTEQVVAQMTPNGGTSMRDAVNRVETRLDRVDANVDRIAVDVGEHSERLATVEALISMRTNRPGLFGR